MVGYPVIEKWYSCHYGYRCTTTTIYINEHSLNKNQLKLKSKSICVPGFYQITKSDGAITPENRHFISNTIF